MGLVSKAQVKISTMLYAIRLFLLEQFSTIADRCDASCGLIWILEMPQNKWR